MAGRSEARRFVLQMLYLVDQNPEADNNRIQANLRKAFGNSAVQDFAWQLFTGVLENRDELDEVLRKTAVNWRVDRMPPTDRNVLRLGLYEMTKLGTPPAVVIDEAIEIAREFGTENSSAFVNGILDRLIPKDSLQQPESGAPESGAPESGAPEAIPSEPVTPESSSN